jgi:hypothetical protein
MPIKVACQCGQQFAARDELAGKRAKCPQCGTVLTIPQPRASQDGTGKHVADLLDDAGVRVGIRRCPGCGAEMGEAAVLCVMCGFDTRLGHRLKTRVGTAVVVDDEDLGDLPTHGNEALDAAERQIALDKLEQKRLIKGAPWWMILLAFLGLIGFAIGMVSMPQERVVQNSGILLQVAGGLIIAFYGLRIVITAFKESALQGLLSIILPPYYIYSRWDRVAVLFILMAVGGAALAAGFLLIYLAPMLQGKKEDKQGLRDWRQRPAIVMVCRDTASI